MKLQKTFVLMVLLTFNTWAETANHGEEPVAVENVRVDYAAANKKCSGLLKEAFNLADESSKILNQSDIPSKARELRKSQNVEANELLKEFSGWIKPGRAGLLYTQINTPALRKDPKNSSPHAEYTRLSDWEKEPKIVHRNSSGGSDHDPFITDNYAADYSKVPRLATADISSICSGSGPDDLQWLKKVQYDAPLQARSIVDDLVKLKQALERRAEKGELIGRDGKPVDISVLDKKIERAREIFKELEKDRNDRLI